MLVVDGRRTTANFRRVRLRECDGDQRGTAVVVNEICGQNVAVMRSPAVVYQLLCDYPIRLLLFGEEVDAFVPRVHEGEPRVRGLSRMTGRIV